MLISNVPPNKQLEISNTLEQNLRLKLAIKNETNQDKMEKMQNKIVLNNFKIERLKGGR